MSTTRRGASTLELLLFVISALAILLALSAAFLLLVLAAASSTGGDAETAGFSLWTAAGMTALALALVPAVYWSGRAVFGAAPSSPGRPSPLWPAAIVAYPLCLALGATANAQGAPASLSAALALIGTAAVPVLLIGWVIRRLGPPITPLRTWGHFSTGLTGMPALALALEAALLLPVLMALGVWMLTTPEGAELSAFFADSSSLDPQAATEAALGFLQSPVALVAIYGYVALAIPMMEELVKTMAVWPFLRRGLSPAHAFLGGALGGAGYALFEALFLTQPGEVWLVTTVARTGATLLHVFTAALGSWGLMEGVRRRRYRAMFGAFAAAVLMHGLWNLAAVTIGVSSAPVDTAIPPALSGVVSVVPALLAMLTAISAAGLLVGWRLLGTSAEAPSALQEPPR